MHCRRGSDHASGQRICKDASSGSRSDPAPTKLSSLSLYLSLVVNFMISSFLVSSLPLSERESQETSISFRPGRPQSVEASAGDGCCGSTSRSGSHRAGGGGGGFLSGRSGWGISGGHAAANPRSGCRSQESQSSEPP